MKSYLLPGCQKGAHKLFFLAGVFFFIFTVSLFAQTQADSDAGRREFFVILDVSGSMNQQNRFNNVQDYLDREVVDGLLKNGDNFTLITFGEGAEEQFTRTVTSDSDRATLKAELGSLRPDDDYTDIGTAMEKLAEIIERPEKADTRRVILFITDGLNAPPPGSKYYGVDISMDERFKSLGERISRGSWFFYVIGIGGETSAQDIANLIPGSEMRTTGSDLGGVDLASQVIQHEEQERARLEEERRVEEARQLEERRLEEARRLEEERLEAERSTGFMGVVRRLAFSTGVSPVAVLAILALLVLLLLFLIVFLIRASKPKTLVITDEKETLTLKISPFGKIVLNSPEARLPNLGNENAKVLSIQRGLSALKMQTLDPDALAVNSPYKKAGTYPLKGVVNLANGAVVKIRVR